MKVASKHTESISFEQAFLLEKQGELDGALTQYNKLLKKTPTDIALLARLMIVTRRLKKYSRELQYINAAIRIYEARYGKLKTKSVTVAQLSKKLNASLGHTDKKGKNLLSIPEVEKLQRRKTIVQNKIKRGGQNR